MCCLEFLKRQMGELVGSQHRIGGLLVDLQNELQVQFEDGDAQRVILGVRCNGDVKIVQPVVKKVLGAGLILQQVWQGTSAPLPCASWQISNCLPPPQLPPTISAASTWMLTAMRISVTSARGSVRVGMTSRHPRA